MSPAAWLNVVLNVELFSVKAAVALVRADHAKSAAGISAVTKARNEGAPAPPEAGPANTKFCEVVAAPVPPLAMGTIENEAVGAAPAPPPSTKSPAGSAAEVAHVDALEKYGIPPEVPATVNAGVVVDVATEIKPPVNETEVTVPVP
jgi:hypothetical protein